jgi:ribose 5-phosphate isomerase B
MKVAIACDHAGFPLKALAMRVVRGTGHEALDLGTDSDHPVDYPDFVEKAGRALQNGDAQRCILICGSGVGAAMAANKMRGIRAGLCHDTYSAHQAVEHDDINVLTLGARVIGPALAQELMTVFLNAKFSGKERHLRRIKKVTALEAKG